MKLHSIKKIDSILLILIISICIVGGLTVFSTTYFPLREVSRTFINQIFFYVVGFIIFFVISAINYKRLNNKFVVLGIFVFTLLSLLFVLFFGDNINGAKRWLNLGFFTLQPSELTKIAVIIIAAYALTSREKLSFEKLFNVYEIKKEGYRKNFKELIHSEQFLKFLFSLFSLGIFVAMIMLQKSLGNTLLVSFIYFGILFMAAKIDAKFISIIASVLLGITLSFNALNLPQEQLTLLGFNPFLLILGIILILAIAKYSRIKLFIPLLIFASFLAAKPILEFSYNNVIEDYQRGRIETFLNPNPSIELTDDYNRRQSINAIGAGQIIGSGYLNGNIVKLNLLPFAFTDFAFAAFAEQFGFIGSFILICLFFALIMRVLFIGRNSQDNFGRYICFGVGIMIFLNTAQHIGMNIGILPITGVPLPLISSGGSAIITVFLGLGLVQSVKIIEEEDKEEITNFSSDFGIKGNSVLKTKNY